MIKGNKVMKANKGGSNENDEDNDEDEKGGGLKVVKDVGTNGKGC